MDYEPIDDGHKRRGYQAPSDEYALRLLCGVHSCGCRALPESYHDELQGIW